MTDASIWIGSNELCLLWKTGRYLRRKFLYLKRSSIVCKKFQIVHPEPCFTNFQFFWGVLVLTKLLLLFTDASVWIGWNELCLNTLEGSFFTFNDLVLPAKVPESFSRTFFDKFLVFWGLLVQTKLLLLITNSSVQIGSNELCLLWNGWQIFERKVS